MTDRIRDHSEPCKHKLESDWDAAFLRNGYWLCRICPGGRDITIDYEAARKVLNRIHGGIVDAAVDAALPDQEI